MKKRVWKVPFFSLWCHCFVAAEGQGRHGSHRFIAAGPLWSSAADHVFLWKCAPLKLRRLPCKSRRVCVSLLGFSEFCLWGKGSNVGSGEATHRATTWPEAHFSVADRSSAVDTSWQGPSEWERSGPSCVDRPRQAGACEGWKEFV